MSCRPSIVPPFVKHFVAFSQETASRTTSPYIKAQLGVTKANFLVTDKCKEIDALPCPWRKKHQCSLSLTMLWYWFCSLITHSGVKIRQKVSFSYFANEANYFFGTWKFIKFIKFDWKNCNETFVDNFHTWISSLWQRKIRKLEKIIVLAIGSLDAIGTSVLKISWKMSSQGHIENIFWCQVGTSLGRFL